MFTTPLGDTSCNGPGWDESSSAGSMLRWGRIADNRLRYQVLRRDARRAIVHRFPYGVFYRVETSSIVVFCVSHLQRDPTSWKARVG